MIPGLGGITGFNDRSIESMVGSISGRMSWLRSDLNITTVASKVSGWGDRGGGTIGVSQSTDAQRPLYVSSGGANNLPYLDCGVGLAYNALSFTDGVFASLSSAEAFFVFQQNEESTALNGYGGIYYLCNASTPVHLPAPGNILYDNFGSGSRFQAAGTSYLTDIQCYNSSSGPTFQSRRNGEIVIDTVAGPSSFAATGQRLLGDLTYNTVFLYGKFYEFIMFSRQLTASERLIVQSYINKRYSIVFP